VLYLTTERRACDVSDTITPKDVGLGDDGGVEDDSGHGFFDSDFLKGPARVARWAQPITYLHIYQCDAFSVSPLVSPNPNYFLSPELC
jgi:cysteamine dioxygenase